MTDTNHKEGDVPRYFCGDQQMVRTDNPADGDWVLAKDYDALVRELTAARGDLEYIRELREKDASDYARALSEEQRRCEALQAKVDALMLEYCPDEMTPEQTAEWARHQRPVQGGPDSPTGRGADLKPPLSAGSNPVPGIK